MGKFKPFLFGALFGAGTVFIGLQYHIVQSHEGVRVVPRTPQHAIGLAYVDIRNWGAEQWVDRPELARALVAHGSTDLVASSVTEGLVESISSDSAILDELRGFVNESAETGNADSLFNDSDFEPINGPSDSNSQDLMTIPFEDARRKRATDAASTVNTADRPSLASRDIPSSSQEPAWKQKYRSTDDAVSTRSSVTGRRDIPSVDDVFQTGRNTYSGPSTFGSDGSEVESENDAAGFSAQRETKLLENMLFGDEDTSSRTSRPERVSESGSGFEDITNTLEQRAEQALQRARAGFQQQSNQSSRRSADSANRYVRDSAKDSYSAPASSMFSVDSPKREYSSGTRTQLSDPLKAIRDGFDPFVE
jgi:hypothetical protein